MPSLVVDAVHAFTLVGVAELGDKSQLVCLALATRYRAAPVIAGALLAFGALNAAAIAVGALLAAWVPGAWLSGAAGLVMIGFGVSALRGGGGDDDAGEAPARAGHPVLVSAAVLAFAELGDKTQLSVATLAAVADPLGAWLGATLALLLTSTVAAVAGGPLLARLPARGLRLAAGAAFVLSGLWLLGSAL